MRFRFRRWLKIRLIISAVMIVALGIGFLIFLIVPHRLMRNIEEELRGFTPGQTAEILAAYDITIPENEKGAYIYCFSRSDRGLGGNHHYVWCLEIAGVRDYDAFFAANSGRVLSESENERQEAAKDGLNYYVTYIANNFDVFYKERQNVVDRVGEVYEKMRTAKGYK